MQKTLNKKRIIVPKANAHEAALISGLEVIGVDHITELIAYVREELSIAPTINGFIKSLLQLMIKLLILHK